MADPHNLSPETDLLAAELGLGLLEGGERLSAERMRLEDPDFAAAVEDWQRQGIAWLDEQPAAEPSDTLWPRIEASLARGPSAQLTGQAEHARAPHQAYRADPWKSLALAASLAMLIFAGLWLFDTPDRVEVPVQQPLELGALSVAQINEPEDGTLLSAVYDRETGRLYCRLAEIQDPQRVPQLWLLDAGGTPRSLGFGGSGAVMEMQLTEEQQKLVEQGVSVAVSLEEPADVPHETPSDVLGIAELAPIGNSC